MKNKNTALWDRLAGTLYFYIADRISEYYDKKTKKPEIIEKYQFIIEPFGEYFIPNSDILRSIALAQNINELSKDTKDIVLWYLPIFLEVWPEYKNAECLEIKE